MQQFAKHVNDYLYFLRLFGSYRYEPKSLMEDFTYQDPSDANLLQLREQYELDRVAGDGDELSQIMNLMRWVHRTLRHDGSSSNPSPRNALNIIKVCKEENRGVNCRMLAITLTEVYLAMGYKSRFITCMPMGMDFQDCHVVSIVYARSLERWIYVDPTFEAYAADEGGNLLGIEEFREALIRNQAVHLPETINWNGQPVTREGYLGYMAKNLFRFSCYARSEFNIESERKERITYYLHPMNYEPTNEVRLSDRGDVKVTECYISNPELFWKKP